MLPAAGDRRTGDRGRALSYTEMSIHVYPAGSQQIDLPNPLFVQNLAGGVGDARQTTLEATQGPNDGLFGQLPYKCH